ncbi:MAG: AMP-binding protein [Planctomycetota bacterium]
MNAGTGPDSLREQPLLAALLRHSLDRPHATALHTRPGIAAMTWSELIRCVASAAKMFGQTGHRKIIHRSSNSPEDVVVALACMASGKVEVPLDGRLTSSQHQAFLSRNAGEHLAMSHKAGLLTRSEGVEPALCQVQGQLDQTRWQDPALILQSGGSTGKPKGVVLSVGNLASNAAAKLNAVPQEANDRRLAVLPLSHAYARTCDLGTWLLAGCELATGLGWAAVENWTPGFQPTLINTVPALNERLWDAFARCPQRYGSLRLIGCGGAPLLPRRFHDWRSVGLDVIQGYGLTECSPVVCSASPENQTPGEVGGFVSGWKWKMKEGELYVQGPGVMLGYDQDEKATASRIDGDGWLRTGDRVECSSRGHLRVLGRVDDVLVLPNGYLLDPIPIEWRLKDVRGVDHAAIAYVDSMVLVILDCKDPAAVKASEIESLLVDLMPPGTPWRTMRTSTAWSIETGELTVKGTPRRDVIVERVLHSVSTQTR